MLDRGVGIFLDGDFEIFLGLGRVGGVGLLGPFLGPIEFLDRVGLAPVVFGLELVVSRSTHPVSRNEPVRDEREDGPEDEGIS